jgi:hypothetical protein
MPLIDPRTLFIEAANLLANANCPQCGKKDESAKMPGRKHSGGCRWCNQRKHTLVESRMWLEKGSVANIKKR